MWFLKLYKHLLFLFSFSRQLRYVHIIVFIQIDRNVEKQTTYYFMVYTYNVSFNDQEFVTRFGTIWIEGEYPLT